MDIGKGSKYEVLIYLVIGVIIIVALNSLLKNIKGLNPFAPSESDKIFTSEIRKEVSRIPLQDPKKLTYARNMNYYITLSNLLYNAMRNSTRGWGLREEDIITVFAHIKNKEDFNELRRQFGIKDDKDLILYVKDKVPDTGWNAINPITGLTIQGDRNSKYSINGVLARAHKGSGAPYQF